MSVTFDKKQLIIIAITLVIGFAFGLLCSQIGGGYHMKRGLSHMKMNKDMNMKIGGNMRDGMGMRYGAVGSSSDMSHRMAGMSMNLEGKTGDDFDRAFLNEMIIHHEGAVKMAELAKTNANHQEIKNMADLIISAQNKEIGDMKAWSDSWFGN